MGRRFFLWWAVATVTVATAPDALAGQRLVVTSPMAMVYAAPDASSERLSAYGEGEVLFSPGVRPERGWYPVELEDRRVGWVQATDVSPTDAASPAPPAATTPPPPPAPRHVPTLAPAPREASVVLLRRWRDLPPIIRPDPFVTQHWRDVRARRSGGWVMIGVGAGLAAVGSIVGGVVHSIDQDCGFLGACGSYGDAGLMVIGASLVVGASLIVAGAVTMPGRGDYYDVVDSWNARHPERQIEPQMR